MPNKTIAKIARLYDIDEEESSALISYHSAIRANLNDQFATAMVSERTELKASTASKVNNVFSQGLGAIPGIGDIIGALSSAAGYAGEAINHNQQRDKYHNLLEQNPAHDPESFARFNKDLATKLVEGKLDILRSLSPKEAKEEANKDAAEIIKEMESGRSHAIDDSSTTSDLINLVTPDNQIPVQAEHKDIGSFTHSIMEKESHQQSIKDIISNHNAAEADENLSAAINMEDLNLEDVTSDEPSHSQNIEKSREKIAAHSNDHSH